MNITAEIDIWWAIIFKEKLRTHKKFMSIGRTFYYPIIRKSDNEEVKKVKEEKSFLLQSYGVIIEKIKATDYETAYEKIIEKLKERF